MKVQIKNRFTAQVIFECEADSFGMAVKLAIEAKANLRGADLSRADLSWANLSWADPSWANLRGANLSGANLRGAGLSRADLSGADLSRADLSGANLSRADLRGANLSGANLSRADLSRADLSWANLSWADPSWANLSGAKMFDKEITKPPLQIGCGFKWFTTITENHIQIGCQVHLATEWFAFTDEQITDMHNEALPWWNENKEIIKALYEKHSGVKL
jgi:hypothetical protein